ncbi:carboxylesterase/lipase family protein [Xanthomonas translucens pv. translucens]|uniref:Carboxylic ester hydrolase n=2 Tax=Xanthomonas campestris pv. translucens TaxID=343 RepID=A0ABW9KW88_XANCT|nr:carboxylesterase/lipase family protein [Xanthomonas translucens]MCT8287042.1 carboxylesterase/lipase family protein [Xanthomonas translucens pv. translucens]MCT8304700.1 carboxylesterase/lipase family protein [Xanthomonas translucens pv. translucens]QSQ30770.1 carboxylesterase/lipase family protein [Xanthomonas translucens pv. translucens]QSQ33412.1 carboxylesterase/lipase family protein [Xanthomonas translucens pv. translucens]UNT98470.1 carboxylesterase/lipase family protein [Xanthomonas 
MTTPATLPPADLAAASTAPDDHGRRRFLHGGALGALALSGALPGGSVGAASADPQAPLARTRSGRIRGCRVQGVQVFKGIPYGADTAPRRFQPALQEQPWRGVRDCTRYAASAPQLKLDPVSEDCLFLNLWTPALRDGAKRPILFYVHGGAYSNGSGSDPLYDGARLCRRGDVVVISVNHRLNAFGYLYLAQLGSAAFAASGNVGQLDLVQALQWVRAHAAEFGGDAGNVTVFGQSGGGAKIATLMAMPAAQGLFHRAWTMSGQQVTAAGPRAATQRAQLLLQALQLDATQLAALRTLPLQRLLETTRTRDPSRAENTSLYLGPVLDAQVLHRHPFWPDAPPQSAKIPMVIGNTHDETRAFLGNDPANFALSWDTLPARLQQEQFVDLLPQVVIAEYRRLYPHYTPSAVFFAATSAGRSWRGAIEEAEARARQGAPTWAYQLDWGSPLDGGKFGAFHTLDIPLVFDNIRQPGSRTGDGADAQRVADAMSEALLAFARHGDPNHARLPRWEPYSLARRETMLFDADSRLAHDPRGGERRLYQQVPFVQRGTL